MHACSLQYVMHTQPLSTAPLPIQLFHKLDKQSTAGSRGGGKSRPSASRKLEVEQSQCVAPCAELVNVVVLRDPLQRMLSHLKHIVQVYSKAYCGTKFRQAYMSYMRAKMRRSRVKSRKLQHMPDGEHARHLHASEQWSGNEAAMEEDEGSAGAEAEDEHVISVRSGSYNVHVEEDEESLELLWAAALKASVGAGSSQQHEPAEAEDDDVSVLQYGVHADAGEHGFGSSSRGSHGPSGQQQRRRLGRRLTDTAADSAVAAGRCLFTHEFNVSDARAWRRLAPAVVDNYMTRALLGHRFVCTRACMHVCLISICVLLCMCIYT